jgi:hypothetical protein
MSTPTCEALSRRVDHDHRRKQKHGDEREHDGRESSHVNSANEPRGFGLWVAQLRADTISCSILLRLHPHGLKITVVIGGLSLLTLYERKRGFFMV